MGRHVDDLDLRMTQELVEVGEDRLDAEPLADTVGRLGPDVEDADHALPVTLVAG